MEDRAEFLLELFSEEVPAKMQNDAAYEFKKMICKFFTDHGIKFEKADSFATPCRITVHVSGVQQSTLTKNIEVKGPKIEAPQAAIMGFCKANGVTKDQLSVKTIKDHQFYFLNITQTAKRTKEIISNDMGALLGEYVWPKSMYWGNYDIKWARPLKNIMCLFGGEIADLKFGHLVANNKTYGHKFMSGAELTVTNFIDYREKLKSHYVILDFNQRKQIIQDEMQNQAQHLKLKQKDDDLLLNEVVNLVEWPQVMIGQIPEKFLDLPSEILVSSMRLHQKYFCLYDAEANIAPFFLFVSNITPDDKQVVISGNEKVLSARLNDALYFFQQDSAENFLTIREKLRNVIFHDSLGTVYEKTNRMAQICQWIDKEDKNAEMAALHCKNDITTQIVDEFPNLQGIMGYYYAKKSGLNEDIALAISQHYRPQGSSLLMPSTKSAALVAISDKIDSLCGLMLAGLAPTSSKDPYALRRQALGVIRIIIDQKLEINIKDLVAFSCNLYADANLKVDLSKAQNEILNFINDRACYYFKDFYDHKLTKACIDLIKIPYLADSDNKLHTLSTFIQSDNGKALIASYKRCFQMLEGAKINIEHLQDEYLQEPINKELFIKDIEKTLYETLQKAQNSLGLELSKGNYDGGLNILCQFTPIIEEYFAQLMIMDDNHLIAHNRIKMLYWLINTYNMVVNFSLL